ncbi:MAG: Uma2 family endonuclease [Hyphomicrobiaceae bacterium]|nr:Uma2 family endonuclease [Hyphomicrobiaceae bacterium]
MTIEEFLAFTHERPKGERWELIEGAPVLNPSPIDFHQVIVTNIVTHLMTEKITKGHSWLPFIGTGTRVPASKNSLPQPDALLIAGPLTGTPVAEEALVIFEVMSRSNTKADQAWRRKVYASVPNCQYDVTVSLKGAEITAFDRDTGWAERTLSGRDSALDLPALGVTMPLEAVYRYTPIGA